MARLPDISSVSSMSDTDKFIVIVSGDERLISKSDLQKIFSGLSPGQRNKLSQIITSGDGTKILTDKGEYITVSALFNNKQFKNNNGKIEIADFHSHNNLTVIDKLSSNENGELIYNGQTINNYTLPPATNITLGGVKVDGTTITVSEDGTISGSSNYELPAASASILGGVKVDGDTIKINNGVISADVINNWSSGTSYPVGYFAVHDNKLYQCNTANSDSEWTENKWNLVGDGGEASANITEWKSGNAYAAGNGS